MQEHSLLPLDVAIAGPWILVRMPNWGNKEPASPVYVNDEMAQKWPTSNGEPVPLDFLSALFFT